jgi:hypothetical protein
MMLPQSVWEPFQIAFSAQTWAWLRFKVFPNWYDYALIRWGIAVILLAIITVLLRLRARRS